MKSKFRYKCVGMIASYVKLIARLYQHGITNEEDIKRSFPKHIRTHKEERAPTRGAPNAPSRVAAQLHLSLL